VPGDVAWPWADGRRCHLDGPLVILSKVCHQ
jgi:hypothetical protein